MSSADNIGTHLTVLRLSDDYINAQTEVLRIEARIRELAEAGDHKRKIKVINTEWVKATLKRNQALRKLQEILDKEATDLL